MPVVDILDQEVTEGTRIAAAFGTGSHGSEIRTGTVTRFGTHGGDWMASYDVMYVEWDASSSRSFPVSSHIPTARPRFVRLG